MRILVIPSWYPSGASPTAGIFVAQQVRALAEQADVAVLYVDTTARTSGPALADEGGVTVVRTGADASGVYQRFFGYRRTGLAAFEVMRGQWGMPDIIHVQALWPAALTARAVRRTYGVPYVVTEHSEEYLVASERRLVKAPGMVPFVLRPLARGASRTIAVSRFLADRLTELGLAVDPTVIPNVVPVIDPAPAPVTLPHRISHVSVMGPAKNLAGLLRAAEELRRRRSDFVLQVVGDGELKQDLERLAGSLGLGDVVAFTGRVPEERVREILAESAFTVVSSTHETFSVSAAESLMAGRPVLCTRCGGPEEFITPEVGRLIEAGSVEALVEGLDWTLDHYREFDPHALHEYACARFAPDVVAAQVLDVYREVLGG